MKINLTTLINTLTVLMLVVALWWFFSIINQVFVLHQSPNSDDALIGLLTIIIVLNNFDNRFRKGV